MVINMEILNYFAYVVKKFQREISKTHMQNLACHDLISIRYACYIINDYIINNYQYFQKQIRVRSYQF